MPNNKILDNPHFCVDEDEAYCPGVYKIENKKYIYIGSTTTSLSRRFWQHYNNSDGKHYKTQAVLRDGGDFICLETFYAYGGYEPSEEEIRNSEAKYIRLFSSSNKILLNDRLPETFNKEYDIKYASLNIPQNMYSDIIDYLQKNGYLILNKTVYHKKFDPLNDFDDLALIYVIPDFEDIIYMKNNNTKDENRTSDCYDVVFIKEAPPYNVYLEINGDIKVQEYDIALSIWNFPGFKYYEIEERINAIKQTIPEKIRIDKTIDKNQNIKYEINKDDLNNWFATAYDYLNEITFNDNKNNEK